MAEKSTSNKEHPLAGVVLCLTSVLPEQRTELATIAGQMGATHQFDLTSDVTHLIAGEINTPKYKFVARERPDVLVLKPEWIEAVRQSWMQGGDTDIRLLEEQYKFPTFAGLTICITGFEDLALRSDMENMAVANGAEFRKDLTKSVSHLVSRNTEGQKYKFATQWNVKVVTMKWFSDSIERGMLLEETLYHPLLPADQQGVGACNRSVPRVKEKPSSTEENSSNRRPRKLRRIASAKLEHQNEGIWGDIVGTGFDSDPKGPETNQQKNDDSVPVKRNAPVIQVAKSFSNTAGFADAQSQPRQPAPEATTESHEGLLHGCFFFIYGFPPKHTSVLRHHLPVNGAQLVGSLDEFSRADIPKTGHGLYIIVSHRTRRSEIPSTDDMAFECEVVTDMWLERCLDAKSLVPPESHVANTPVPLFPIPGFRDMKICSTGFSPIDLLHLTKLVNLIGASYNEYLTSTASVLVCQDPRSVKQDKLRHASEWGVTAVSRDWLWDSIQAGEKKSFDPYIVMRQSSQNDKCIESRAGSYSQRESSDQAAKSKQTGTSSQPVEIKEDTPDISHDKGVFEEHSKHTNNDSALREKQQIPQKRHTISQSRSPSPRKEQNETATDFSSVKRQESNQSTASAAAFDLAVNGLLKQARAASSRSATDSGEQNDTNIRPRRHRKPLLGRAPSHSSAHQAGFSRASSIDTLNEDGCGSGVESVATDRTHANSRNGNQSFNSIFNEPRFEFGGEPHRLEEVNEEDEAPPMTQLNYEDPDAVAMRKQFLRDAGKLVEEDTKPQPQTIQGLVDLEDGGWGTGKRTRRAGAKPKDGLEDF